MQPCTCLPVLSNLLSYWYSAFASFGDTNLNFIYTQVRRLEQVYFMYDMWILQAACSFSTKINYFDLNMELNISNENACLNAVYT